MHSFNIDLQHGGFSVWIFMIRQSQMGLFLCDTRSLSLFVSSLSTPKHTLFFIRFQGYGNKDVYRSECSQFLFCFKISKGYLNSKPVSQKNEKKHSENYTR